MDEMKIMEKLTEEVLQGFHKKENLPNAANDFSANVQADYFSIARKNMSSDLFHIIAYGNQQINESPILM